MPDTIRVFLVDDHEVVRRGLADLLGLEEDMEVVGEASNKEDALHRIPAARPDVAVLDVRLPDGSGVEVCRDIRASMPDVHCLMLTSYAPRREDREELRLKPARETRHGTAHPSGCVRRAQSRRGRSPPELVRNPPRHARSTLVIDALVPARATCCLGPGEQIAHP